MWCALWEVLGMAVDWHVKISYACEHFSRHLLQESFTWRICAYSVHYALILLLSWLCSNFYKKLWITLQSNTWWGSTFEKKKTCLLGEKYCRCQVSGCTGRLLATYFSFSPSLYSWSHRGFILQIHKGKQLENVQMELAVDVKILIHFWHIVPQA